MLIGANNNINEHANFTATVGVVHSNGFKSLDESCLRQFTSLPKNINDINVILIFQFIIK